jgi:hypothetical protein
VQEGEATRSVQGSTFPQSKLYFIGPKHGGSGIEVQAQLGLSVFGLEQESVMQADRELGCRLFGPGCFEHDQTVIFTPERTVYEIPAADFSPALPQRDSSIAWMAATRHFRHTATTGKVRVTF